MNKTRKHNLLSSLLCAVLIAAMALSMMGCNEQPKEEPKIPTAATTTEGTAATTVAKVTFTFTVTDKGGNSKDFTIATDKKTVGDALLAEGLIEGENGAYGLYVKTVNGITADYDTDSTYWAFYVNGEYASKGVDQTEVVEGAKYAFKVEG
ncbi:MAG: DUF4430 domain-containing protein [Ruminococcaceae bacterium]|nr:DUF4430 domain-containing protein [Oscillospiraceae bacterium]